MFLRNGYIEEELECRFNIYQDLKKDKEYCKSYQDYIFLFNEIRNEAKKFLKVKTDVKKIYDYSWRYSAQMQSLNEICSNVSKRWSLKIPIDPDLNIKKEDLRKSIRPNSSLSKLIDTFGLKAWPIDKKKKKISKSRFEMEQRIKKFECYSIYKLKKNYSALARKYGVDKETIKNWNREVAGWSPSEKQKVMDEFDKGNPMRDKDIYHDGGEEKEIPVFVKGKNCLKVFRPSNLRQIDEQTDDGSCSDE